MNRLLVTATVLILAAVVSGPLLAQSDPAFGTWKLNLAKSKYSNAPAPKSLTRTVEAQDNGFKVSYEGVSADGSQIAYGFTARLDGSDFAISGSGTPAGADFISLKRINMNTTEATFRKGGGAVLIATSEVSNDGKVTTTRTKGAGANAKESTLAVFDKQ